MHSTNSNHIQNGLDGELDKKKASLTVTNSSKGYPDMMMEYLTVQTVAEKWNISVRRLQAICAAGRIEGVKKFGSCWAIPADAKKPEDLRVKSGKYIKEK